jgi:hypothetical protein
MMGDGSTIRVPASPSMMTVVLLDRWLAAAPCSQDVHAAARATWRCARSYRYIGGKTRERRLCLNCIMSAGEMSWAISTNWHVTMSINRPAPGCGDSSPWAAR